MSTLAEIEAAIESLPEPQIDALTAWLEQRRARISPVKPVEEPDFLARAKTIWGENPPGTPLSEIVSQQRGER